MILSSYIISMESLSLPNKKLKQNFEPLPNRDLTPI
jgi:hypothetical protein